MLYLFLQLQAVAAFVDNIARDRAMSGEMKYRQVFSAHAKHKADELLQKLNIPFTWDDPDLDYEDDVRAYAEALTRTVHDAAPLREHLAHLQAANLAATLTDALQTAVNVIDALAPGGLSAEARQQLVDTSIAPARAALAEAKRSVL